MCRWPFSNTVKYFIKYFIFFWSTRCFLQSPRWPNQVWSDQQSKTKRFWEHLKSWQRKEKIVDLFTLLCYIHHFGVSYMDHIYFIWHLFYLMLSHAHATKSSFLCFIIDGGGGHRSFTAHLFPCKLLCVLPNKSCVVNTRRHTHACTQTPITHTQMWEPRPAPNLHFADLT